MRQSTKKTVHFVVACLLVCFLTSYLPKPAWLLCPSSQSLRVTEVDQGRHAHNTRNVFSTNVIDPYERTVARMFLIYNETLSEIDHAFQEAQRINTVVPQPVSNINILPSTIPHIPVHLLPQHGHFQPQTRVLHHKHTPNLENKSLSHEISDNLSVPLHQNQLHKGKNPEISKGTNDELLDSGTIVNNGSNKSQESSAQDSSPLPECVHFVGPEEMKSPRICIHPPQTDRVISMFLRDKGHWEIGHIIDMEWALLAYPDMQLVDLGCNLGVFTLYAAGMGRHVVAVDVLLSNLNLLRTSLTLNDLENHSYRVRLDSKAMYTSRKSTSHVNTHQRRASKKLNATASYNRRQNHELERNETTRDKNEGEEGDLSDVASILKLSGYRRFPNKARLKRRKPREYPQRRVARKLLRVHEPSQNLAASYEKRSLNNNRFSFRPVNISTTKRSVAKKAMRIQESSQDLAASYEKRSLNTNRFSFTSRNTSANNINNILKMEPPFESLGNTSAGQTISKKNNADNNTTVFTISQLVTIVHNAVYSDRTSKLGVFFKEDGNVGGTEVLESNSHLLDKLRNSQQLLLVKTICLDDLLPLIQAPSVFLKIDVEGSEPHVLRCGQKFFEAIHVRYVLMEWLYQLRDHSKSDPPAPFMIRFMTAKGYIPTTGIGVDVKNGAADNRGVDVLDTNRWHQWPEYVLWMER